MLDYIQARTNMIDCQIYTAGVINPDVIEAFQTIPRERFVPDNVANVSYNDEDLALGNGRFLLEPIVHAKMIEALEPQKDHVILDVGCATGYSSAILSSIVSTVVALDEDQAMLERGNHAWEELNLCNIASYIGPLTEGQPENAPYDLIIINGAVETVPQKLLDQLAIGGRMISVIKKQGATMGEVTLTENLGKNNFSSYTLFSAGSPYLPGFTSKPAFSL